MTATLDELRAALHDAARNYAPPPEVTLGQVEQRVVATDRRRRVLLSGVLAAVVATGGGLFAVEQRGQDARELRPGESRLIRDDPAHPVTYRGMVRVSVTEWRMSPNHPITIALPDAGDGVLFARATCTGSSGPTPWLILRHDGVRTSMPCVGPSGGTKDLPDRFQPPFDSVKLARPAGSGAGMLTVETRVNSGATARIAIYVRAGQPVRPPEMDTHPRTVWSSFLMLHPFGPDPQAPNSPVTVKGTNEEHLLVTLVVRGVGTLRVTANGRTLDFGCEADPDNIVGCAGGTAPRPMVVIQATEYGEPAQVYFALDNLLSTPGFKAGEPVTITVTPSGFSGDDWRLDIFDWTRQTGGYYTAGRWTRK